MAVSFSLILPNDKISIAVFQEVISGRNTAEKPLFVSVAEVAESVRLNLASPNAREKNILSEEGEGIQR